MITLTLFHSNGDYEEISTSSQPFYDGYTIQRDCLILDDIEHNGILWQRLSYQTELEKMSNDKEILKEYCIVPSRNLQFIDAIFLNDRMIYPKKIMSITIDDYLSKPKPSTAAR